jgi:hypothetical protein
MRNEPVASEVVPFPEGVITTEIPDKGFWVFLSSMVPLILACGVIWAWPKKKEAKVNNNAVKDFLNIDGDL